MKKTISLAVILILSVTAATAQIPAEIQATIDKMSYEALIEGSNGNYKEATNCIKQSLRIIELQPAQEDYMAVKAELWYDLARYYSMQKNDAEALAALEKAVENGWDNHAFAENDSNLSRLRRNKKYKDIISGVKDSSRTFTAK